MDKDLYKVMQEIMAQKGNDNTSDVIFLGTILMDKESPNRQSANCKRYNCND